MNVDIRKRLFLLQDLQYQTFASALIPNIDNLIGVRLPQLRKIAKEIAKADWETYLKHAKDDYFEELMLQAMVIGYLNLSEEELFTQIAAFVPKIDNWSVCDSFCAGLKKTKQYKAPMWTFIQPYLQSDQEYEIRFGVVMLLTYYVEKEKLPYLFAAFESIQHEGYYVKMAVAWAISYCYIAYPEVTLRYLQTCTLDRFTYNQALQKAIDSTRVPQDAKHRLQQMKRRK